MMSWLKATSFFGKTEMWYIMQAIEAAHEKRTKDTDNFSLSLVYS
jgi:hypothetical protein